MGKCIRMNPGPRESTLYSEWTKVWSCRLRIVDLRCFSLARERDTSLVGDFAPSFYLYFSFRKGGQLTETIISLTCVCGDDYKGEQQNWKEDDNQMTMAQIDKDGARERGSP